MGDIKTYSESYLGLRESIEKAFSIDEFRRIRDTERAYALRRSLSIVKRKKMSTLEGYAFLGKTESFKEDSHWYPIRLFFESLFKNPSDYVRYLVSKGAQKTHRSPDWLFVIDSLSGEKTLLRFYSEGDAILGIREKTISSFSRADKHVAVIPLSFLTLASHELNGLPVGIAVYTEDDEFMLLREPIALSIPSGVPISEKRLKELQRGAGRMRLIPREILPMAYFAFFPKLNPSKTLSVFGKKAYAADQLELDFDVPMALMCPSPKGKTQKKAKIENSCPDQLEFDF